MGGGHKEPRLGPCHHWQNYSVVSVWEPSSPPDASRLWRSPVLLYREGCVHPASAVTAELGTMCVRGEGGGEKGMPGKRHLVSTPLSNLNISFNFPFSKIFIRWNSTDQHIASFFFFFVVVWRLHLTPVNEILANVYLARLRPQPLTCWDYRHMPPLLPYSYIKKQSWLPSCRGSVTATRLHTFPTVTDCAPC